MDEVQIFDGLKVKEANGEIYFDAETAAMGVGLVQDKNSIQYVRWERVNKLLNVSPQVGKGDYITEQQLYKLAIRTESAQAEKFQDWVTSEVLPSIRKTGGYQSQPALRLPENNMEMLQVVQSVSAETNKRVDELSNQFTELKNEFGLPSKVAGKLKSHGAHKVYEHLGGSESNAYKEIGRKVFSEMWHDFKEHFGGLRSYYDLPLSQLQEGYAYINNWQPSTNTKMTISDLNAQIELSM